ncbi:Tyrosine-protein kinase CSK [Aphelenchoides besseyi]|nr:Tyrosine-protein kinase CSK [Aphelenchoides besseyi]
MRQNVSYNFLLVGILLLHVTRIDGQPTSDESIIALSSNGEVLAVQTSSQITIYNVELNGAHSTLNRLFSFEFLTPKTSTKTHEFKLRSDNRILLCAFDNCKFYELDLNAKTEHLISEIKLDIEIGGWAGTVNDDRIVIRAISENGQTANVRAFDFSGHEIAVANDYKDVQQLTSAYAFETENHYYFLGTARIPDYYNYNRYSKKRTVYIGRVRLTRICKGDSSSDLITRMDIHLGCGIRPSNYRDLPELLLNSAFLTDNNRTLFVTFSEQKKSNLMCSYTIDELNDYFDRTWNNCQDIRDHATHFYAPDNETTSYTYTWLKLRPGERNPFCQRYSASYDTTRTFKNCEADQTKSTLDRLGYLENYLPLWRIHETNFTTQKLTGGPGNDTLFVLFENNTLQRLLRSKPYSPPLWSVPANLFAVATQAKDENILPLIFYAHNNTINAEQISCSVFYANCSAIRWEDPLECGYCSYPSGTGEVMLRSQNRSCMENGGRLLVNECPPKITHAVVFQNEFQIVMENVEQFKNLHVQICDNEVTFEKKNSLLKGFLDGIDYNPGCDVVVYGDLRSASDFALRWLSETEWPTTSSMPSSNKARVTRFIVGISAAVVIAILIALIAYTTCYLQKDRTKPGDVELPLPPLYRITLSDAYKSLSTTETGHSRGLSSIPTFSREMFETVKNLGKGHFGRVDLCKVHGSALAQSQVAIKKIPDHIDNMDIVLQEVELLGQCQHENIVRCIGYYFELDYVCVVMEYMAGGDLHKYLTGPKFSEKTDVWSFGVVMWEVFSRTGQPYPDIQNLPEVANYLNAGKRLNCPGSGCPSQIYDLMCSCWVSDPFQRPTFRELHQKLIQITYMLDQTEDDYRSVYLEPRPVSSGPSVVMPSRGSQVSTTPSDKTLTE